MFATPITCGSYVIYNNTSFSIILPYSHLCFLSQNKDTTICLCFRNSYKLMENLLIMEVNQELNVSDFYVFKTKWWLDIFNGNLDF